MISFYYSFSNTERGRKEQGHHVRFIKNNVKIVNVIHQFNKLNYILVGRKINESLFIVIG